jgi:methyl-accepting chemotaxis protein
MKNIVATELVTGNSEQATAKLCSSLKAKLGPLDPALVLIFASTSQPLPEVLPAVQARFPKTTVLGATTAGEFVESRDAKGSIAAIALAGDFRVSAGIGENLRHDVEGATRSAIACLTKEVPGYPHRAALLLLDPLTGAGEEATLITAAELGPSIPLAGGAAGDDLKMKSTQVGCGNRVAEDAVVIALLHSKRPFGLGVAHGHQPISKRLTVTRSEGNTVFELDGKSAWEVWADETRSHAGERGVEPDRLDEQEVGGYLLRYEAGLPVGGDHKIRAPLSRGENGALHFACGIPEGAQIHITESTPERQIDSARRAAGLARHALGDQTPAGAIVFDCICRNLILGDRFFDAVDAMSAELGGVPLAGFETYGEIALGAGDMSGFHNTTTVVLALPA